MQWYSDYSMKYTPSKCAHFLDLGLASKDFWTNFVCKSLVIIDVKLKDSAIREVQKQESPKNFHWVLVTHDC